MTAAGDATAAGATGLRIPARRVERALLWLLAFSGALALIEPSPYEGMFVVTMAGFIATGGIRLPRLVALLAVLLLAFNLGGVFSLIPYLDRPKSVTFVAISIYLMVTAIFYATVPAQDGEARLDALRRGFVASAWVAAAAGIAGYFNIAGLGSIFSLYGRASGTFKDPNVLGPYLTLAVAFMVQDIMAGRGRLIVSLLKLSVPLLALLLTLSRGAWINGVGSVGLLVLLTYLTSRSSRQRARLAGQVAMLAAGVVVVLLVALSSGEIGELVAQRAGLQSYDTGPTGRFGGQIRSIPRLLELPNGFGPLRFSSEMYGIAPHNVFLNAFASYGWLGGISYLVLILTSFVVGWRTVLRHWPLQYHFLPVWSVFFITALQGVQIDSDHWRHFYLLLGLVWGIAATVPRDERARRAFAP